MGWQRARRPEQKDERRRAILEAAAALFYDRDYDAVSLNAIAREVGLAKSNLYRYFGAKEEIFLQLYLEDIGRWVAAAERALEPHAGCDDPDLVARELAGAVADHPRMASLLSLLFAVLERNVSVERIVEFQTALSAYAQQVGRLLQSALPTVSMDQAVRFMLHMHALVTGLWPMGHPSDVVDEVLERPEFAYLRVDFGHELEAALRSLLRQLVAESQQAQPAPEDARRSPLPTSEEPDAPSAADTRRHA